MRTCLFGAACVVSSIILYCPTAHAVGCEAKPKSNCLDMDNDGRCGSAVDQPLPEIVYQTEFGVRAGIMAFNGPTLQPLPTVIFGKRLSIDADEFFILPGANVSICAPIELRRLSSIVPSRGITVYAGNGNITVGRSVHFKKGTGLLLDSYNEVRLEDGITASGAIRGIGIVGNEIKIGRSVKLEGDQIYLEARSVTVGPSSVLRSRSINGDLFQAYGFSTYISADSFKADRIRLDGLRIQLSGFAMPTAQSIELTNSRVRNQVHPYEPPSGVSFFGQSVNLLGTKIDRSTFDYVDLPSEL